jgi:hypothetical protein
MPHLEDFLVGKSFTTEMMVRGSEVRLLFRNSEKVDSGKKRFLTAKIVLPPEGNGKLSSLITF